MQQLQQIFAQHPQVYIDTRNAPEQGIFFAVGQKDERGYHRGNAFAHYALTQCKAACVVINDKELYAENQADTRWILVEDCEVALQELARWYRQQWRMPVLAIAGSNGKTTTRQLIQLVLAKKYNVFSTPGNLNNHLGLPLSILKINPEIHNFAVLEIGANHLGETAHLTAIAAPTCGLVTNCGKDHLGEYGSLENIIKANAELYEYLFDNQGIAFVNIGDRLLAELSQNITKRYFYGGNAEVRAELLAAPMLKAQLITGKVQSEVQTQLFGSFWLSALETALAVGFFYGIPLADIQNALENYTPASLRSQWVDWQENRVLLDCYNANPSSMEVFVRELQQHAPPQSILILGEMLELGVYSDEEHRRLVNSLQPTHFQYIILVGDAFSTAIQQPYPNLLHLPNTAAARQWLHAQHFNKKHIFVKGSRSNKLETLIDVLSH